MLIEKIVDAEGRLLGVTIDGEFLERPEKGSGGEMAHQMWPAECRHLMNEIFQRILNLEGKEYTPPYFEGLTTIQKTISKYLRGSAGTGNHPTDHTINCFVGMIETGEATMADFRKVAGNGADWLENRIREHAKEIGCPI